ncbi:MAG: hypothetical protein AB2721_20695 [Candidatus Thiodiazotropha sp.]
MKVNVTKSYLDLARGIINTTVHGNLEEEIGEDAIFSLMSCTYIYSFMALTSFCSSHLHSMWRLPESDLKLKYSQCSNFEQLMTGPLRELKKAIKELAIQLNISPLHEAKPAEWRKLNELIKGYRDYFIHPNPDDFSEHLNETGNLPWNFASEVAEEIIEYFFTAAEAEIPTWVRTSGLKCRGFEVVSI